MTDRVGGRENYGERSEPVLPAIVDGVAGTSGREFFRRLSEHLSRAFSACAVRVSELAPDGIRAAVLGSFSRSDYGLPAEFDLEGTPGEKVALGDVVIHEQHVRRAYANESCLSRMFAEAYVGVPIVDAQGDVLGLIEIFADAPIGNTHQASYISRAMAGRAAAEIERGQAEAALRDSETRYRALIEDSFHLVAEVVDERYIYVSAGYTEALGYSTEELLGGSMLDLVDPDDRKQVAAELKPIAASHEAARYTVRMRHQDGTWRWIESTARAFRTSEGDYRTTIFSRDITQRLAAERELRDSEARFRLLAEHSMDIIGRYTTDLRCTWISPSIKAIAGWDPEEVVGTHVRERIHPDDFAEMQARPGLLDNPDVPRTNVMRYQHKDGHYIWLEAHTSAVTDPRTGEVLEIHNRARDVTARKLAEDQLRDSEEQFRLLAQNSTDMIGRYSIDGNCIWVSPSALAITGYSPEELQSSHPEGKFHPDDLEAAWEAFRAMAEGGPPRTSTFRFLHKDGHYIWLEAKGEAVRNENGEIVEIQSSTRDVTGRKEGEQALKASEELLRATLEASGDGVLVSRVGERILYVNARFAEMFDLDLSALRQMSIPAFSELVASRIEDPQAFAGTIAALPGTGGAELGLLRSNTGRTFEVSATTLAQPDGTAHRVFSVHEVTDLVNASEALGKNEERYRSLSESSPLGVFETDDMAQCTYVNRRGLEIAGITFEEALGRGWGSYIHADDVRAVQEGWNATSEPDREFSMEYRMQVPRGLIWVRVRAMLMRDAQGRAARYVGTIEDVTEQRRVQDALRDSEARNSALLDAIPDMMFVIDRSGRFVDCRIPDGSAFAQFRDRIVGLAIEDVLSAEAAAISRRHLEQALSSDRMEQFEHEISVQGTTRHLETRYSRSSDNLAVAVVRDVTGSRLLVDALRDSEETARALLNAPTDGAVLIERDGTILALNQTAERRFKEYAAAQPIAFDDFVGMSVYDLFPEALREERRNRNEQVFADGHRRHYEDEREGVWTDVTIDPIIDAEGNVIRLAIFSRDITDRKRDEEALLRRSQELEALNRFLERTSAELERSQDELQEKTEQLAVLLDAEQARSKTDPLTAALNHGAISDVMKETIAAEVAFAVAMVDIDGMKAVNDTYGHPTGDAVLLEVVGALNRGGAIVGRYGGDEFIIALLDADRTEAKAYKAAVDTALREAHVIDPETGASVPVVASVGIAWYPDEVATLAALIELADERMYKEKAQRRTSTGLSSSRMFADERIPRMVGELVQLLTSGGPLDECLRKVAHRITLAGGYAAANFDIYRYTGPDPDTNGVISQSAFTRAPDDIVQAWNDYQRSVVGHPVGEILQATRTAIIIDDIEHSDLVTPEQKELLRAVGIRSGFVAPLFAGDDLIAAMSVGKKEPAGFSESDASFLTGVAAQIAGIIDLARRADQAGGHARGPSGGTPQVEGQAAA